MAIIEWLKSLFRAAESPNRNLSGNSNEEKIYIDLLSNLFGTEEARKQLLNLAPTEQIKPEQVLKDSQAMELMLKTYPWRILEQAMWRNLLGDLRISLSSGTLEQREAARNRVMARLSDLHLPFELRFEADRIKKMQEMTKVASQQI